MDRENRNNSRRTLLVVEDNALDREMVQAVLEPDFDVVTAEDGLVGLEVLATQYQDLSLILLDVFMPRCDGFEFLRRMRSESRYDTVPVIIMTASDNMEDEIRCLELGANDFVVKPVNVSIMTNRINNMIRLRESASLVNRLMWDEVTRLYSKEFFGREVEESFDASPESDFDMVCVDIDDLQTLNDRYGEDECDEFLRQLAEHLMNELPEVVVGGRITESSFAFLTNHGEWDWESITQTVSRDVPNAGFGAKLGIVEVVDKTLKVSQICSLAMSAIETLKDLNETAFALFDQELHQRQLMEQAIRESMETALKECQFSVFFQPKHNVHTGRTGGAEALARWFHPTLGFISPGVFIPIFEKNGFITKLDSFVWEEACREIRRCVDFGLPAVPISVNASRLDFEDEQLSERLARAVDKYGIDRSMLHVELTETACSDNLDLVTNTLVELKNMGFSTELDDFGAGYSALATLNTLPLDVMKLDMSLIRQASMLNDFRIIEASIRLAQLLGLQTVVEGVETADEVERVKSIGCDLIQGYYYSKPITGAEFEEYLAREVRE